MINVFELYGSWQGRIGRLVHVVAVLVLVIFSIILDRIAAATMGENLQVLLPLLTIYPGWVLSVKRAHDLGKSGWWVLGWATAAIPAAFVAAAGAVFPPLLIVACVLVILSLWNTFIKLFFFAGQIGPNDYGPPSRMGATLLNDDSDLDRPTAQSNARMAALNAAIQAQNTPRPQRTPTPSKPRPQGFGRRTTA